MYKTCNNKMTIANDYIKLNYNEIQGRYLTATQDIQSNTLIHISSIYTYSIYNQYKKRICTYCLNYNDNILLTIHCTLCNTVYYCNDICQNKHIQQQQHTTELCELYSRLQSCKYKSDNQTMCIIKLVCNIYIDQLKHNNNIIQYKNNNNNYNKHDNTEVNLNNIKINDLFSHYKIEYLELATYIANNIIYNNTLIDYIIYILGCIESNCFVLYAQNNNIFKQPERRLNAYYSLNQLLLKQQQQNNSNKNIVHKIDDLKLNELNITTEKQQQQQRPYKPSIEIGRVMYLSASMFNHSCQPNCSIIHYNNQLHIFTVCEIKKNNELTISYIDINVNATTRQQKLLNLYNFTCNCVRCQDELNQLNKQQKNKYNSNIITTSSSNNNVTNKYSFKSLLSRAKQQTNNQQQHNKQYTVDELQQIQQYINQSFILQSLQTIIDIQQYNITQYTINNITNSIHTLYYIPKFITDTDHNNIINQIKQTPLCKWTQLRNRRLQNWGGHVTRDGLVGDTEIPLYQQSIIQYINQCNIFNHNQQPNHVLLNEYKVGQGISPHKDGPMYTDIVCILSLNNTILLKFYEIVPNGSQINNHIISILCEPCSLLIFTDDLYHKLWHSIDNTNVDIIDERVVNRHSLNNKVRINDQLQRTDTRYSLTIRHVPTNTIASQV